MAKGNPNPSPATRFKKGQSGNPSGKSAVQAEMERKASRIAAGITLTGLSYVQEKLETGELSVMDILNADILRFIQEAQNRAHGTPKQSLDVESPQGTMSPKDVDQAAVASLISKLLD
jgi:hypothetical protein